MKKIILCKFGEIALKGANRAYFEKLLKVEIKRRLRNFGKFKVYSAQSTVYIEPLEDSCDMDFAYRAAKNTFGVSAVQMALEVPKDINDIISVVKTEFMPYIEDAKTFKVAICVPNEVVENTDAPLLVKFNLLNAEETLETAIFSAR